MSRPQKTKSRETGPSQRQLRAGELIRHALVEVLREEEISDPSLANASLTITEVRMSPDLKHAICFVEVLGAGVTGAKTTDALGALNHATKFIRGRLAKHIDLKFTPDLKFFHDESFNAAARMDRLFDNPRVQADLARPDDADDPEANNAGGEA